MQSLKYRIQHSKSYKQFIWLTIALGSISTACLMPVLVPRPVLGAERLTLSYGLVERSVSIDSLEQYAKTGKVDDELAAYVQYAPQERLQQLRQVLLTPIPLGVVEVSQFLYTPIGERLLENLAEVIQGENPSSGLYAIRASLILAAADSQEFTLLNVLRKFPSREISINLVRALEIADSFRNFVNQTQSAIALINKQAEAKISPEVTTDPLQLKTLAKINLLQSGPIKWQKQTITLNDLSRNRVFPADIYLPLTSVSSPVIVISHGLGSDRTSFAYLAERLASYGFAVAVPEHPGSNTQQLQALLSGRAANVTSPTEFIDRPLDIKYLLDQLTKQTFARRLNLEQVGIIGQSFGGYTALALAGAPINVEEVDKKCPPIKDTLNISLLLQCLAEDLPESQYDLSDPRVKAAIAINPIASSVFGQDSLSQIKIPVMIITGSADTIAPALPEQIQPFTWLTTPNKYLALINNATHFSTIAESPEPGAVPVPEQAIGPNPALSRRYINILGLAFFKTYVANQPNYSRYLSADFINTISQQPLPLSLVQTFAPNEESSY